MFILKPSLHLLFSLPIVKVKQTEGDHSIKIISAKKINHNSIKKVTSILFEKDNHWEVFNR